MHQPSLVSRGSLPTLRWNLLTWKGAGVQLPPFKSLRIPEGHLLEALGFGSTCSCHFYSFFPRGDKTGPTSSPGPHRIPALSTETFKPPPVICPRYFQLPLKMEVSFISDINFQSFGAAFLSLHGKNSPLTSVGQEKEIGRMSLILSKCRCSFIQEILTGQILDSSRHYINISE